MKVLKQLSRQTEIVMVGKRQAKNGSGVVRRGGWCAGVLVCLLAGGLPALAAGEDLSRRVLTEIAAGRDAKELASQAAAERRASGIRSSTVLPPTSEASSELTAALDTLAATLSGGPSAASVADAYARFEAQDLLLRRELERTAQQLDELSIGGEVEARLRSTRKLYLEVSDRLHAALAPLADAVRAERAGERSAVVSSATLLARSVADASSVLASLPRVEDPEVVLRAANLPYRRASLAARTPRLTPVIVPSYLDPQAAAPGADELSADVQAPLSVEILEKAAELNHDAVAVYEFVRNTIKTEHYAGAMKGALGTLAQGSGNDVDQASLLIALLRACLVPARYVEGVLELPVERLAAELQLADPAQVPAVLGRAGLAFRPVIRGGRVAAVEIEHTWVAAYVPYTNYRGAVVDFSGRIWVPLAPALKTYDVTPATAVLRTMSFPVGARIDAYLSAPQEQSLLAGIRSEVEGYLQAEGAGAYEEQLGAVAVAPEALKLLPSSMPAKVVVVRAEQANLPAAQVHRVRFVARQGTAEGSPVALELEMPLAEVVGRRVTLSYTPATVEDHRAVNAWGGLYAVPLYLVQLRPQIKIAGQPRAVGTGGALDMGAPHRFEIELSGPTGTQRVGQTVITGAYHAVALSAQRVVRPAEVDDDPTDSERLAARLLSQLAHGYASSWDEAEAELSGLLDVTVLRPLPSVVVASNAVAVQRVLGLPYRFEWKGVTLDAALRAAEPTARRADTAAAVDWMRLSALEGSALEQLVFREQFQVDAISADKGLGLARAANLEIVRLTSANLATELPNLNHPATVKTEVENWVRQGLVVEVPREPVSRNIWSGSVWRVEEPTTGAGGYFLSGRLAGGSSTEAPPEWVLDFLVRALAAPYSAEPNANPLAVAQLQKIPSGDGQEGEVGQPFAQELSVLARDRDGRPVVGAQVTFNVTEGGGKVGGASSTAVTTDELGIARVVLEAGRDTSASPVYLRKNAGDEFVQQALSHIVDASAPGLNGTQALILTPFEAVAFPGPPASLVRTSPEDPFGTRGLWSDTLQVAVRDQYSNPVANVPVTFAAGSPQINCDEPVSNFRNAEVFLFQECPVQNPRLGQCGSSSVQQKTGIRGASAGVILGNVAGATYTIQVSAPGVPGVTSQYTDLDSCRSSPDVTFQTSFIIDENSNNIQAVRAGQAFSNRPMPVTVLYESVGYEIGTTTVTDAEGNVEVICTFKYLPDRTWRATTANLSASVTNGGAAGPFARNGEAYESVITTGLTPGFNSVRLTVSDVAIERIEVPRNPPCDPNISGDTTNLGGPFTVPGVYGLNPLVNEVVPNPLPLNVIGQTTEPVKVSYVSPPDSYRALWMELNLYEDGQLFARATGASRGGTGDFNLQRGLVFDINKTYEAEVIANRGTLVEVKGERFELPLRQPIFFGVQRSFSVSQDVDVLNERVCAIGSEFSFGTTQEATVTLTLRKIESTNTDDTENLGSEIKLIDAQTYPAGEHSIPVLPTDLLPGEYRFLLSGVSALDGSEDFAPASGPGFAVSRFLVRDNLPVGHAMYKGVDLFDGHLSVVREDLSVPGRKPFLHLVRAYSSKSEPEIGPMGYGWSHSYDAKVVLTQCGDAIVTGAEGGGGRFVQDGPGYRPLKGYHGTLLRSLGEDAWDYYSKDGTRSHFVLSILGEWILDFIEDPNGNRTRLVWDRNAPKPKLVSVTDAAGRSFNFRYEQRAFVFGFGDVIVGVTGPGGLEITYEYDNQGNMARASREAGGLVEEYTYADTSVLPFETRNQLTSIRDTTSGAATSFTYEKLNIGVEGTLTVPTWVVTSIEEPEGGSSSITYDGGALENRALQFDVTVTDRRGSAIRYTLNKYGSPLSVSDPNGDTEVMTWSPDDVVMTSRRDGLGTLSSMSYDAQGNLLTEETSGSGFASNSVSHTYLAPFSTYHIKDRVSSTTNRNGFLTNYSYDGRGNLTRRSVPAASLNENFTYDGRGDQRTAVDGNGNTVTLSYDSYGNVVSSTDAVGSNSTSTWDVRSRLTSKTDALGRTTRYEYDTRNRRTRTTYPDGTFETITYDDAARTRTFRDAAGRVLVQSFDLEGRLIASQDPLANRREMAYDPEGNKITESNTFGSGVVRADTTYTYDPGGRLTSRNEPLGRIRRFTYDGNGNVLTETIEGPGLAAPQQTVYTFDGLNRQRSVTRQTASGPATEQKQYDGEGNVVAYIDALGRQTSHTYDALNRLKSTTDPLGGVVQATYDPAGNKLSETDALGRVRRFEYDNANRLTKRIDAQGKATIYEYDLLGNLTREIDPRLHQISHTYDEMNRRVSTQQSVSLGLNPVGSVTTRMEYDAVGNLTSVTLPNGNVVAQAFDGLDRLVSKTDTLGTLYSGTYDAAGNLIESEDANGNITRRQYDALNRMTREEMPGGRVRLYSYDAAGNRLTETDPNGGVTRFDFDPAGRLIRVTDPAALGTFIETTYDLTGLSVAERDRRGNTTTYTRDRLGRVTTMSDPASVGTSVSYTYDAVGNKLSETDRRGITTEFSYDAENRLTAVSRAGVTLRTLQYDNNGNLRFDTDANGNIVGYEYDERNLRVAENRPLAAITRFGLDRMGDVVETRDPENRTGRATYDLRRRRLTDVDGAGNTTTYSYDGNGNRLTVARPEGGVWTSVYDDADRLESVRDPLGNTTTYSYDNNGNRLTISDGRGKVTSFEYDARDRLTATIYPGGARDELTLDGNGNVVSVLDPKGQTTSLSYDALNRPDLATYSAAVPTTGDELVTRDTTYDGNGNLVSVVESYSGGTGSRTTTTTFDDFDRETSTTDPQGKTISYAYDAAGNRTQLRDPDGRLTTYGYDALNRLTSVTVQLSGVTQYEYFRNSLLKRVVYPNGSESRSTYDAANRLTLVDNKQGAATISSYTYSYDRNANRTRQVEVNGGASETTNYQFDLADRLVAVQYPDKTVDYTYDAVGNRLTEVERDLGGILLSSKSSTFDDRNRVTRVDNLVNGALSVVYGYDNNGNQISRAQNGVSTTFLYDSRDQLVEVQRDALLLGRYLYDHQGLRVRKTGSGEDLRYVYDDESVLLQTDAAGNSIARYEYGPDRLLSLSHVSEGRQFYLFDGLGSISNLTKPDGTVQARYQYDAWGNPRSTVGSSFNPFGFTGQERDDETGLYYFKARFYDPELGRFLNEDPAAGDPSSPPSLHKYLYAHANPTVFVDPDGRQSVTRLLETETMEALEKGENAKAFGYVFLRTAWNVFTFGFLDRHDAARDAYDDGKITYEEYASQRDKAIVKSAIVGTVSLASGGVGAVAGRAAGLGTVGQITAAGAVSGGATQIASDAVEGRVSSVGDVVVASTLGGVTGNVLGRVATSSVGQKPLSELVESGFSRVRSIVTGEAASGGTTAASAQATRTMPAAAADAAADAAKVATRAEAPAAATSPRTNTSAATAANAAPDELVVIGRRADTAVAKNWPGHKVLDLPDNEWSLAKNDAWVQKAIDARQTVYLASPPTRANLFDAAAGRATVFGREYNQFVSAGFKLDGVHLRPPTATPKVPSVAAASEAAKRGPKPKGEGPHNLTIERRIQELKDQGMEHVAGGSLKEEFIRIIGGIKSARRPDITMRRPDGSLYRENVGRRAADGSPVRREVDALDDLERQLGERPGFTPYD